MKGSGFNSQLAKHFKEFFSLIIQLHKSFLLSLSISFAYRVTLLLLSPAKEELAIAGVTFTAFDLGGHLEGTDLITS